jgi:DNA-binding NarL/FixJ family response regulator
MTRQEGAVRVVIGEDETLLRAGLLLVLDQGGFDVVGSAGDRADLIRCARHLVPDMIVTDIRMPPGYSDEGLRAALDIRAAMPNTAVVVLSHYLQRQVAMELLAGHSAGTGYLLKQRIADVPTFCQDLRTVCDGGTVLDPDVVTLMVSQAKAKDGAVAGLTERQRQVLALMAAGHSNTAIARKLTITERAVVQHASKIYDQLGLVPSDDDHRRVLAVLRYLAR